jgi:hypothetical protein
MVDTSHIRAGRRYYNGIGTVCGCSPTPSASPSPRTRSTEPIELPPRADLRDSTPTRRARPLQGHPHRAMI